MQTPASNARPGPGGRRTVILLALLVGALGALVPVLRVAIERDPTNQLWAEDGTAFVRCAVVSGLRCLVLGHQGYLNVAPRLVAAPADWVDLAYAPIVILLGVGVVCGVVAVTALLSARRLGLPLWASTAAGLLTTLAPLYGGSVAASAASLQWVLLYGALWCLVPRWPRRGPAAPAAWWAAGAITVGLAASSAPLAVALAPVAVVTLVRGIVARCAAEWILPAVFLVVLLGQLAYVLTHAGERTIEGPAAPGATMARGLTHALAGAVGVTGGGRFAVLGAAAAVLALAAGALVGLAQTRVLVVSAVVCAAALLVLGGLVSGLPDRYVYAAAQLLTVGVIASAAAVVAWVRERWPDAAGATLGALLVGAVVACVLAFAITPVRASGPAWRHQVAQARTDCAAGLSTSARLDISPTRTPPWTVRLPCADVGSRTSP